LTITGPIVRKGERRRITCRRKKKEKVAVKKDQAHTPWQGAEELWRRGPQVKPGPRRLSEKAALGPWRGANRENLD